MPLWDPEGWSPESRTEEEYAAGEGERPPRDGDRQGPGLRARETAAEPGERLSRPEGPFGETEVSGVRAALDIVGRERGMAESDLVG